MNQSSSLVYNVVMVLSGFDSHTTTKYKIMNERKKRLDNMERRWTTFPSGIIVLCSNIKTRMVSVVWNNEEPLSNFSMVK